MKRITWVSIGTGAVLLFAGCTSTSGTATPATTTGAPSSSSTASSSSASPSSVTSPTASATASSATASSGTASSATASSGTASSATASSGTASEPGASGPATARATKTLGDTTAGLDDQSATWLTALCDGIAPILPASRNVSGISSSDPTVARAALVKLYSSFGSSYSATAAALKTLAPPTFSGGSEFASTVIRALETAGPLYTADAEKVSAIDPTKDPAAVTKAAATMPNTLSAASAPMQDFSALRLTPQTRAAFEKLPACADINLSAG